jgi:hypothetical protein
LHWALQARRVQFPGDPDPVLVTGPEGPQGIFRLTVDELVALARANVGRELTQRECRDFFEASACPVLPAVLPDMTSFELPDPAVERPLAGTRVTLVTTFIGETAGGLGLELEAFTERTGIAVEVTAPSDFEATLEASGAAGPTSGHRVHRATRHRGVVRRGGRTDRPQRLPRPGCGPDTDLGPPRLTGHRG